MKFGFHPWFDNPVRMGYVPEWKSIDELMERLGDLEHAIGQGRVTPARWEPFYQVCPCCRDVGAYIWARKELQQPDHLGTALAFFPEEGEQTKNQIGHANWLITSSKSEESAVTRKMMLAEALELWETHGGDWIQQVTERCIVLGAKPSLPLVREHIQEALQRLAKSASAKADVSTNPEDYVTSAKSHAFNAELMQMDGWSPDPGIIILPVDGRTYSLSREILRLDLHKVVLLKARNSLRSVPWEKVTMIHLFDGRIIFEIADEPALEIGGYKNPENVLRVIQQAHRLATERILQGVAAQVIRTTA